MQVSFCQTTEVEGRVHVDLEGITATLLENVAELDERADRGRTGTVAVRTMMGAAYQCLLAVTDEMLMEIGPEHCELIAGKLIEQADRYRSAARAVP